MRMLHLPAATARAVHSSALQSRAHPPNPHPATAICAEGSIPAALPAVPARSCCNWQRQADHCSGSTAAQRPAGACCSNAASCLILHALEVIPQLLDHYVAVSWLHWLIIDANHQSCVGLADAATTALALATDDSLVPRRHLELQIP